MSQTFTCPKCGAPQDYQGGAAATIKCPFCGTTLIVPPELRTTDPDFSSFGDADWNQQAAALVRIKELADAGQEIAAIKLYRETYGTGLAESKAAVEAIMRGENFQVAKINLSSPDSMQIQTPRGTVQINTGGDADGSGVRVITPSYGAPTVTRWGNTCATAIVVGVVLVVLASIVLPLMITGATLFTVFSPPAAPTSAFVITVPTRVRTATAAPSRAPSPSPTPGFAAVLNRFGKKGTAPGQLNEARFIAADNAGNVYVGDRQPARVLRYDNNGKFVDQWTLVPGSILEGMTVDTRGNVYTVQDGVISKYNGITGDKLGDLQYDAGPGFYTIAAAPDGGLYANWSEGREGLITSIEGHRDDLVHFDRSGKVTQVIKGVISSQTGDFELDNLVASDGSGNLYILASTQESAVFKFSPTGKFLDRFGSSGDAPGQFYYPEGIAVDGRGRVYIAQRSGISIFEPDGRYLGNIGGFDGITYGVAFDADNHMWVNTANQVFELQLQDQQ